MSEATKIQDSDTVKTVQTPAKTAKQVETSLFIPTEYSKRETERSEPDEDGIVTTTLTLSEPVAPESVKVDPKYQKQTHVVKSKDGDRIEYKILNADDEELETIDNLAAIDR